MFSSVQILLSPSYSYINSNKEFLPEPNDFLKFFLGNDSKWFFTFWYLQNLDFHLSVLNPGKKMWKKMDCSKLVVKFVWLIVWLTRLKMHQQAHSLARFIPMAISSRIRTSLILLSKNIIQKRFSRWWRETNNFSKCFQVWKLKRETKRGNRKQNSKIKVNFLPSMVHGVNWTWRFPTIRYFRDSPCTLAQSKKHRSVYPPWSPSPAPPSRRSPASPSHRPKAADNLATASKTAASILAKTPPPARGPSLILRTPAPSARPSIRVRTCSFTSPPTIATTSTPR